MFMQLPACIIHLFVNGLIDNSVSSLGYIEWTVLSDRSV